MIFSTVSSLSDTPPLTAGANEETRFAARYRALVRAVGHIVWTNSAEGEMRGEQPEWCAYTGQTEAECQGFGWAQAVHPDDAQPSVDAWLAAVNARGLFDYEHRVRRADGVYRWFSIRAVPVLEADGSIREWVGLHRDIEDIKEAERNIARERTSLKRLLRDAPVVINFLKGDDLVFEVAHPTVTELVGRDLEGVKLLDALPEMRDQPYPELLRRVLATGEPAMGLESVVVLERDGERRETYWNYVYLPVRDASGAIEGVMTCDVEVTEQVRARQALDHARNEAVTANRAKDEFLAMLGHELRNPLAPITTALELIRSYSVTAVDREVGVIERQVRHLGVLVDDLLDVSRITTGKVALRRQVLELAEVTARAVEMAAPLIEERGHTLAVEIPSGLFIHADEHRLGQIVANLLTNAAKYTPAGGTIRIAAARAGSELRLSVSDTGVGISAELLPHVFDLFVQGRQESHRPAGGLGIGLAIVSRLVSMHGGRVEAASDGTGKGSTFTVILPADPSGPVPVVADIGPAASRPGKPKSVLVVDDNVDAADMLSMWLESRGYETRTAHDGPSALGMLASFAPDVAVLDIGLPVMDGYELARRLRADGSHPKLTLVALTGFGQESDRQRARDAGFDAHVIKPVDLERLAALIESPRPTSE
jgi:PAS domain S-box-containing protein